LAARFAKKRRLDTDTDIVGNSGRAPEGSSRVRGGARTSEPEASDFNLASSAARVASEHDIANSGVSDRPPACQGIGDQAVELAKETNREAFIDNNENFTRNIDDPIDGVRDQGHDHGDGLKDNNDAIPAASSSTSDGCGGPNDDDDDACAAQNNTDENLNTSGRPSCARPLPNRFLDMDPNYARVTVVVEDEEQHKPPLYSDEASSLSNQDLPAASSANSNTTAPVPRARSA